MPLNVPRGSFIALLGLAILIAVLSYESLSPIFSPLWGFFPTASCPTSQPKLVPAAVSERKDTLGNFLDGQSATCSAVFGCCFRKDPDGTGKTPYISYVVPLQLSEYGSRPMGDTTSPPDPLRLISHRVTNVINWLDEMVNRYNVSLELLFVLWPPTSSRDVIEQLRPPSSFPVRVIYVSPEAYASLNLNSTPFECYAKNVAIRRAKGTFIALAGTDSLVSPAFWHVAGLRLLRQECFYGGNRVLIPEPIPAGLTGAGIVQWFLKNHPAFPWENVTQPWGLTPAKFVYNAGGDFTLMSRDALLHMRGYPEVLYWAHMDSILEDLALASGLSTCCFSGPFAIWHQVHHPGYDWQNGKDWGAPRGAMLGLIESARGWKMVPVNANPKWGLLGADVLDTRIN